MRDEKPAGELWQIADERIPTDVKECADNWRMGETMRELWRGAFIEGWRACEKSKR